MGSRKSRDKENRVTKRKGQGPWLDPQSKEQQQPHAFGGIHWFHTHTHPASLQSLLLLQKTEKLCCEREQKPQGIRERYGFRVQQMSELKQDTLSHPTSDCSPARKGEAEACLSYFIILTLHYLMAMGPKSTRSFVFGTFKLGQKPGRRGADLKRNVE
ncbi:hypothetical protein MG293_008165 [Ovis ammon polii]|uniref:Uncharacterized protein n=1 Tax=Ovis ammon polii TaxID=230172 RepID=A0AAD4U5W1_OVIAM|nr:hypothetical protein MG293_008165 [Ovis ammon polii]